MNIRSNLLLIALASGFALALPVAEAATIKATLYDDSIKLDSPTTAAGKVTFVVTNAAPKLMHELVVLKTDKVEDQLPVNAKGKVDEVKFKNMGEAEDIAAGKTKKVTLKLTPGHYVLICNIVGHYKMGMHTELTVN